MVLHRICSRSVAVVLAAVALVSATARPAAAHATFDRAELPAATDVDLVVRVPLERPGFTNARIEALVPADFEVRSCAGPSGAWRCEVDTRSEAPDTLVTWQALPAGGPDDIRFDLDLTTPESAGEHLIPVIQTYNDGHEARWIHEGGNEPAPRLTVVAGAASPSEPAPEPTPHAAPSASAPPSTGRSEAPSSASPSTPAEEGPPRSATPQPAPAPVEATSSATPTEAEPAASPDETAAPSATDDTTPDPSTEANENAPSDEAPATIDAEVAAAAPPGEPRPRGVVALTTVAVVATGTASLREHSRARR